MSKPTRKTGRYWKIIPGLLVSAFFLWRTLRGFHLDALRGMHFGHPAWLLALVVFITVDYALRGYRWWLMMRSHRAPYSACCRVLMTSLAANNILPFRIGDFMRIFAYAPDVNAAPPTVLSTVLLERLLDVVMLLAFAVAGISGIESSFSSLSFHGHGILFTAKLALAAAVCGLALLLFGTRPLHWLTQKVAAMAGRHPRMKKLEEWAELLFDAVLHMSFPVRVWLVVLTAFVWAFESLVFYSAARTLNMDSLHGSLLAASLSNLSFLLPSAPGGIGPFEAASKLAMESQGFSTPLAIVYALYVHFLIFMLINLAGGVGFLLHRRERGRLSKPLVDELASLPTELRAPETH